MIDSYRDVIIDIGAPNGYQVTMQYNVCWYDFSGNDPEVEFEIRLIQNETKPTPPNSAS